MFSKSIALIPFLCVLWLCGCLTTQDTTTRVPYEEINRVVNYFEGHHKSPLATLYHKVWLTRDAELKVQLQHQDGQIRDLKLVKDELVDLPNLDPSAAKNWTLVVNQPPWMVRLSSGIKLNIVDTTQNYQDVFMVLEDLNHLQRKTGKLPQWYLSDYDKILFSFSSPASIQLESGGEMLTFSSNEGNVIVLQFDEARFAENGRLHFSQLPQSSVLFTEVDNFPATQALEQTDKPSTD